MFTPSDREIANFFENLTPEAFAEAPTDTHLYEQVEDAPVSGPDDFERFTLDHLRTLIDEQCELAVIHDGTTARFYQQRPDETSGEWLLRVSRDAKDHSATWVFLGMPGEASFGDPDKMFNPANPADVERARQSGYLVEVINWYAESTEPASPEVRFGVIVFEDNDVKVIQSTNPTGANPAFRRVLHS